VDVKKTKRKQKKQKEKKQKNMKNACLFLFQGFFYNETAKE
jgi:hypothetical protein